jgi:hypothetical protein
LLTEHSCHLLCPKDDREDDRIQRDKAANIKTKEYSIEDEETEGCSERPDEDGTEGRKELAKDCERMRLTPGTPRLPFRSEHPPKELNGPRYLSAIRP